MRQIGPPTKPDERTGVLGAERRLLWLSDIPPGVSAQGYRHLLTILSAKNATFEYIDLGRGPREANRPRKRSPRSQIPPVYWLIDGTTRHHLLAVTRWSHDVGYYVGPSACFTPPTRRIPPDSRDWEEVRWLFEIDVLKSCGYLQN